MHTFFSNLLEQLKYNPQAPLLFNSSFFLFFFFFVLVFNRIFLNNKRAKVVFLMLMSIYFYYKSSGIYFYLVIVSSLIDYFAGMQIFKAETKSKKRFFLILSLVTNLGLLGYFKYTYFILDTFGLLHTHPFDTLNIFLPVGISFFTFQSMSYSIDIYRGRFKPEYDFINFLFFVSFFPQLVAGPIVRAADFLPQIHEEKFITDKDIGRAMFLIIAGLLKKAVIADYISINFIDRIFEFPARHTGIENLLGLYGYGLQIYCDFSGYSDMAIGLALLLGFRLPDNFNAPYKSATITELWRRWHISLSSWLKDYLYISMGGNRKGKWKTYRNLMLTMLLGGLWHGAAWRFVIWGGFHGLALAVERFFHIPDKINKTKLLRFIGIIITLHLWLFSMIFFRSQSYDIAFQMIHQILFYLKPEVFWQWLTGYPLIATLMVIGYVTHYTPAKVENKIKEILTNMPLPAKALVLTIVIWIVAQFKSAGIQPFIYFQF